MRPEEALQPAERENAYPEPGMFGAMPSHAFFIRHVKGIELSDIKVIAAQPDARPGFVLNDVQGADFSHINVSISPNTPTFVLNNVEDFSVDQCKTVPDTKLAKVEEKKI